MIMLGTEKQVKFATDIQVAVINTLKQYENENKKYKGINEAVEIAIHNIEHIDKSWYLITHLKDVCYKKKHKERVNLIIDWMKETRNPDFEGVLDSYKKNRMEYETNYWGDTIIIGGDF